jgi:hypothetical protein
MWNSMFNGASKHLCLRSTHGSYLIDARRVLKANVWGDQPSFLNRGQIGQIELNRG